MSEEWRAVTLVVDEKGWLNNRASLFEVECFVSVCIISNNCGSIIRFSSRSEEPKSRILKENNNEELKF